MSRHCGQVVKVTGFSFEHRQLEIRQSLHAQNSKVKVLQEHGYWFATFPRTYNKGRNGCLYHFFDSMMYHTGPYR